MHGPMPPSDNQGKGNPSTEGTGAPEAWHPPAVNLPAAPEAAAVGVGVGVGGAAVAPSPPAKTSW